MMIRLPDLNIETSSKEQVEKIKEEINEFIKEVGYNERLSGNYTDQALLCEALDVIQAIAGFLVKQDQAKLTKTLKNHTLKLKKKYGAKGYTMFLGRSVSKHE